MPVYVKDLDDGLGNVIIGTGVITNEEYDTALTKHLSQPSEKFKKYIYSIVDFTTTTHLNVHMSYFIKNAKRCIEVSRINPNVLVALVTHNNLYFIIGRTWGLLASGTGWNIQIFRTRKELDTWLLMKLKDQHDMTHFRLDYDKEDGE